MLSRVGLRTLGQVANNSSSVVSITLMGKRVAGSQVGNILVKQLHTRLESNAAVLKKYTKLNQPPNQILAEYIWIDGSGENVRSKTRTLEAIPTDPAQLPEWSFDGSSTGQAVGSNSDVYLKPVVIYPDPIRRGPNVLVMCETMSADKKAHPSNTRASCVDAMNRASDEVPMFGLEQEYSLLDGYDTAQMLGWPRAGFPAPQGPYYCGIGAGKSFGRDVVEAHYRACLYSGIMLGGINAEVMASQWEFQIGPATGIKAGDDLWMARFLLHRIAEEFNIAVTFDPKPMTGDWNGAGCHANFSTKSMRAPGGLRVIEEAMPKLARAHTKHIERYDPKGGLDNMRRLTGKHETSSMDKFSFGVANRGASVRIPRAVADEKCGFLEDRRPSSNMDPYVVTELLVRTIVLDE